MIMLIYMKNLYWAALLSRTYLAATYQYPEGSRLLGV